MHASSTWPYSYFMTALSEGIASQYITTAIGGGLSSSIKAFQFWFALSWGLTLGLGALHATPV